MTVLVIAEHDNQCIKPTTLNCLMAAAQVSLFSDGLVHLLVMGHNAEAAVEAAAHFPGVATVLHAEGRADNLAAHVLAVSGNYSHIMFAATANGKGVATRVADQLDVAQISDVTRIESMDTFESLNSTANAMACVQSLDAIKVITVCTTAFDAAKSSGGSSTVEAMPAVPDQGKASFLGSEIATNERTDLTAVKVINSGGPALGSSEKVNVGVTPLAEKLGAAMGAPCSAVDAIATPPMAGRRPRPTKLCMRSLAPPLREAQILSCDLPVKLTAVGRSFSQPSS